MTWQPHDADYHREQRRGSALLDLGQVLSASAAMAFVGGIFVGGSVAMLGFGLVGVGVKTIKRAVKR